MCTLFGPKSVSNDKLAPIIVGWVGDDGFDPYPVICPVAAGGSGQAGRPTVGGQVVVLLGAQVGLPN